MKDNLKDIVDPQPPYVRLKEIAKEGLQLYTWLGEETVEKAADAIALQAANEGFGLCQEARVKLIRQGMAPLLEKLEKSLYGALACFDDDKIIPGIMYFAQVEQHYEELKKFLKEVENGK